MTTPELKQQVAKLIRTVHRLIEARPAPDDTAPEETDNTKKTTIYVMVTPDQWRKALAKKVLVKSMGFAKRGVTWFPSADEAASLLDTPPYVGKHQGTTFLVTLSVPAKLVAKGSSNRTCTNPIPLKYRQGKPKVLAPHKPNVRFVLKGPKGMMLLCRHPVKKNVWYIMDPKTEQVLWQDANVTNVPAFLKGIKSGTKLKKAA